MIEQYYVYENAIVERVNGIPWGRMSIVGGSPCNQQRFSGC